MAAKKQNYSGVMDPNLLARAKARAEAEYIPFSRLIEWALLDFLKNTRPRERIKKQRTPAQEVTTEAAEAAPPALPSLAYRDDLKKESTDAA